jgi:hypothetical protein
VSERSAIGSSSPGETCNSSWLFRPACRQRAVFREPARNNHYVIPDGNLKPGPYRISFSVRVRRRTPRLSRMPIFLSQFFFYRTDIGAGEPERRTLVTQSESPPAALRRRHVCRRDAGGTARCGPGYRDRLVTLDRKHSDTGTRPVPGPGGHGAQAGGPAATRIQVIGMRRG